MAIQRYSKEYLRSLIRTVDDFPFKGFPFADIQPTLTQPGVLNNIISQMAELSNEIEFDLVVAIEARGLIFGSALACATGRGLAMVRKKGNLPGKKLEEEYRSEYSTGMLEIGQDIGISGQRCLIVDDFLATGGTASSAGRLVCAAGAVVAGYMFFIEERSLDGRLELGQSTVLSLLDY